MTATYRSPADVPDPTAEFGPLEVFVADEQRRWRRLPYPDGVWGWVCAELHPDYRKAICGMPVAEPCNHHPATASVEPARFRTGRRQPRNLYRQLGPVPSDADPTIGMLDTPALAAFAVAAMNGATDG